MKTKTHNCSQCNKEIVLDEIKRIYGKESDVYKHKFCSAKCFTLYITKDSKPQPTPGKLFVDGIEIRSNERKDIIGKVFCGGLGDISEEEGRENQKKIVKCWNNEWKIDMHEELIDALKEFIETSPCKNGCKKDDMTCLTNRSKALIKQAEQK